MLSVAVPSPVTESIAPCVPIARLTVPLSVAAGMLTVAAVVAVAESETIKVSPAAASVAVPPAVGSAVAVVVETEVTEVI